MTGRGCPRGLRADRPGEGSLGGGATRGIGARAACLMAHERPRGALPHGPCRVHVVRCNRSMNDIERSISRFLEDLRSGSDRRSWDDRRSDERSADETPIAHERSEQTERRRAERRRPHDRRSSRFFAFTERERLEIQDMFADPRALVACPRCGDRLILASPQVGVGADVVCIGCRGRLQLLPGRPSKETDDRSQ